MRLSASKGIRNLSTCRVFIWWGLLNAVCLASTCLEAQTSITQSGDIGTPASSSVFSGDATAGTASVTTYGKGIGAVSGGDEVAFVYSLLSSTGRADWTQPTITVGAAGRTEGLMIRSTLDPCSAMVFFGYQCDGSGVPHLVLLWRKAGSNVIFTKQFTSTPSQQLRLEWMRHQVVALSCTSSVWTPLYAFDLDDDANSVGKVFGGIATASGTAGASWTTDAFPAVAWTTKGSNSSWWKVSEPSFPYLSLAPRSTTIGSQVVTGDALLWQQTDPQTPDPWLTNGDHFYVALPPDNVETSFSFQAGAILKDPVNVYARWGTLSGQNAADAVQVNVSIDGVDSSTAGASFTVASRSERTDPDMWVYLGQVAASDLELGKINFSMSTAETSGFLSIDAVLFLSEGSSVDSDGSGIPDWWKQEVLGQTGKIDPNGDANGDGISNIDDYSQQLLSTPGWTPVRPVLTIIDAQGNAAGTALSLNAPLKLMLQTPLRVRATYSNGLPVPGFVFNFGVDQNMDPHSQVLFAQSIGDETLSQAYSTTDSYGVASMYIKFAGPAPVSNPDPPSVSTVTASSPFFTLNSELTPTFTVYPYANHPIGPVEVTPVSSQLVKWQNLASSGQVAANGLWLAAATPQVGTTPGQVQLFEWDSSSSSWRAAVTLTVPSGSPASNGYGAAVRLSGDCLAVQAPAMNAIFVYHRNAETDSWVMETQLVTPANVDDFALSDNVTDQFLAVSDASNDAVRLSHRQAGSWPALSSPLAASTQANVLDYGKRVAFSPDGLTLVASGWVSSSAPAGTAGEIDVYRYSSNVWSSSPTPIVGYSDSIDFVFGASIAVGKDQIVIGAPVRPEANESGGKLYFLTFDPVQDAWVFYHPNPDAPGDIFITGLARDFGSQVWLSQGHVLAEYTQSSSPPAGQIFDSVRSYVVTSTTLNLEQTLLASGVAASVDGGSLFVSNVDSSAGIDGYLLMPKLDSTASTNPAAKLGSYAISDPDADLWNVSFAQSQLDPPMLQNPSATNALGDLLVDPNANLSPLAHTMQWFQFQVTDLAGGSYQEYFPLRITGPLPSQPIITSVAATGRTTVLLNWSEANPTNIQLFHIERAPYGTQSFQEIAVADGSLRSFVDASAVSMQDYTYRMRAENMDGLSEYSDPANLRWDLDGNTIPDWWEAMFLPSTGPHYDPVNDPTGYANALWAYQHGTNPLTGDSDGDGNADQSDTNPTDPQSNQLGFLVFTKLAKP